MTNLNRELSETTEASRPLLRPENNNTPPWEQAEELSTLNQMRPTLVIGTGGTGQQVVTFLKGVLTHRFGPKLWQSKVRLLAFDTAEEGLALTTDDSEIRLEPNAEVFNIGNVPVPSIMQNIEGLSAIRERLGAILPALPPVVLRSGAKQLRPFGLLSLLWNYKLVKDELRRAIWMLAARNQHQSTSQEQGINIFICGSLVGGTGSGTFLDLAHLVRSLFSELGSQAEFCHITGIGVLPQAFPGIQGPNFYPNTAASLQELNHLMVKSGFTARFPDGRVISSQEAPFNLFHIIDGVDERGQTWSDIGLVCQMIAEGLYLQMGSQLGRKGENAFDNLDEALIGRTEEGDGTFFSSFGLGHLVFDAPEVARYCVKRLLLEHLQTNWLKPYSDVSGEDLTQTVPGILPANIVARLQHDPETNGEVGIDLFVPDWLLRKRPEEVTSEATRFVREYGQARLSELFMPQINRNAEQLLGEQQEVLRRWFATNLLSTPGGIFQVIAQLNQLTIELENRFERNQIRVAEVARRLDRQVEAVQQFETGITHAVTTFALGRSGRIRNALRSYFQAAQTHFQSQLDLGLLNAQQAVWGGLLTLVAAQVAAAEKFGGRLQAVANRLDADGPELVERLIRNGVSHISIADETYLELLYAQHKPAATDLAQQIGTPIPLFDLSTTELMMHLTSKLAPNFRRVAEKTIEDAIEEMSGEITARARRQQLFRLATPSWNVNRARLPEGGANLVRLEVLGVPDGQDSLFAGEAMMVTTNDPHRLTALVVTAGAPQSALQQYDMLQQSLEKERGRPFHILPDFMTSNEKGRLTFALGSIFDLVYNQGTFFYYRPADPLVNPIRLGNGLANSIQAFIATDDLVVEASERVDSLIAHMGLSEAIKILSEYSDQIPEGNTRLDEQTRELKRQVRDYVDDLRRIDEFRMGLQRVNGTRAG